MDYEEYTTDEVRKKGERLIEAHRGVVKTLYQTHGN